MFCVKIRPFKSARSLIEKEEDDDEYIGKSRVPRNGSCSCGEAKVRMDI